MKTLEYMPPERLDELLDRFGRLRIGVIGDFFLDKYLDVDPALAEYSIETGKTAHQVVAVRHSPGAAGTVVCNLAALGARAMHAIGFTGDDGRAYELRKDLNELGCDVEDLHCDTSRITPTYLKPRDAADASLAGEHSRYDTKNRTATSDTLERQIVDSLDRLLPQLDAVIAMDQVEEPQCGVITRGVRESLSDRATQYPQVVFWADSRLRIRQFENVIIKPNQFEALGMDNPPPGTEIDVPQLEHALEKLRGQTGAPVCVTRGTRGILLTDPEPTQVPGFAVEGPIDPTGAGDSVTAGAVLALAAGARLDEAALIGNLVASITIEQLATTGTARPEQLRRRLTAWNEQPKE
jgi:rfaE bifunctional protein kinase chain/domain